jgi:hypothetical protein
MLPDGLQIIILSIMKFEVLILKNMKVYEWVELYIIPSLQKSFNLVKDRIYLVNLN